MAGPPKKRGAAHSCLDRLHPNGSVSTLAWPPPSGRSLLLCDPRSGAAVLAEVDTSVAQRGAEAAGGSRSRPLPRLASLLAPEGGAWVFADWGASGHVLALPLAGREGLLAVVQLCPASGELCLRLLLPLGGGARPREVLALEAALGPLPGGGGASQACIAEAAEGGLVLLRCRLEDGACGLYRLQPAGSAAWGPWSVRWLGSFELAPGREVLRILPTAGVSSGAVTLLQYDVANGDAAVYSVEIRESGVRLQCLWNYRWLPNYPNQQIVWIGETCCLVEYTPRWSTLNIGRFDELGGYAPPMGDWWRCLLPSCGCVRGVWPPAGGAGAVVLFDGVEDDVMALCGLPADLETPTQTGLWYEKAAGPAARELPAAVREANWLRRRGALLALGRLLGHGPSAGEPLVPAPLELPLEACALCLLRDLSAAEPGLARRVVAML